jgi:hypothetical protein
VAKNDYREMMEKIQVPAELKERTRQKMRRAEQSGRFKSVSMYSYAAIAAAVVLVIGAVSLFALQGSFIKTFLPAGRHVASIRLSNGFLEFAAPTNSLANLPYLGSSFSERKNWSLAEYEEYMGKQVALPDYLPKGSELTKSGAIAYYDKDAELQMVICNIEYQCAKEGIVTLAIAEAGTRLPGVRSFKEANSLIGSTPISAVYDVNKDTYQAAFTKDGFEYMLTCINLPQKEVIKILYYFLS